MGAAPDLLPSGESEHIARRQPLCTESGGITKPTPHRVTVMAKAKFNAKEFLLKRGEWLMGSASMLTVEQR